MHFTPKTPPRLFRTGQGEAITIADCGEMRLAADEQVTFVTEDGRRHDFAAKDWGFYATPSVNGRLRDEGFKTALVRNRQGRRYVMVVNRTRMAAFEAYCRAESQQVEEWLDERPAP
jgi:hypothetical protein